MKSKSITSKANAKTTSFCKRIVDSGHHEWRFKIRKISGELIIGIWRVSEAVTSSYITTENFVYQCGDSYGFSARNGVKSRSAGGQYYPNARSRYYSFPYQPYREWEGDEYGEKCGKKTIIEMILDFDDLSLKYKINGKDYGVSHKIRKGLYRAAVYMCLEGDRVDLLRHLNY